MILLHIGTNDIGEIFAQNVSCTPADGGSGTAKRVNTLIDSIFTAIPHTHIMLASIIAMPVNCHFYCQGNCTAHPTANLTAIEENFNARLPAIAKTYNGRVTFVDMKEESALCLPDCTGLCPPHLHPNAIGYAKMAEVWSKHIQLWTRIQKE